MNSNKKSGGGLWNMNKINDLESEFASNRAAGLLRVPVWTCAEKLTIYKEQFFQPVGSF